MIKILERKSKRVRRIYFGIILIMTKQNQKLQIKDSISEFLIYKSPDWNVKVDVLIQDKNIWLTQKNISNLFGVNIPAISKHLSNIFEEWELEENSVISKMETTASDGKLFLEQKQIGLLIGFAYKKYFNLLNK